MSSRTLVVSILVLTSALTVVALSTATAVGSHTGSGTSVALVAGTVPQDLDGDGRHRDLNGNGRLDSDDVVTYFEEMDAAAITDHVSAYDFNGNSRIDFDDLVTLFETLGSTNAAFTVSPREATVGRTVSFDASPSQPTGTEVGYEWSFGDGTTAAGRTATHAYDASGTYEVLLTVTDGSGGTDTATRPVEIVADDGSSTGDPRITGYYMSWARYDRNYTPADVPLDRITHLNYAFLDVTSNGTVVLGDQWGDTQNLQAFRDRTADHPDTTFLLSIGGWTYSDAFSDAALTPERRQRFAETAVAKMRTYNFSGIDVDWEYPGGGGRAANTVRSDDSRNFTLLLEAVREELDAAERADGREYELTIAVSADPAKARRLEIAEIANIVDHINVMTYDFHGAWDARTNHNAPLYVPPDDPSGAANFSVNGAMEFWAGQPISRETVSIGLPFYGRSYAGVSGTNGGLYQPFSGTPSGTYGSSGLKEYWDVNRNLNATGSSYEYHWDDQAKVPSLYSPAQDVFVSFDNRRSIRLKAAYARENDWGGVMIWALSHDRNGLLLDSVNDELSG